jgi:hypothetical protein
MTKSKIDENIHHIATMLLTQNNSQVGNLGALIGTGKETDNHQALVAWLGARFNNMYDVELTVQDAVTQLTDHLQEQNSHLVQKCIARIADAHSILPAHSLSLNECRCLSHAMYRHLSATVDRSVLDAVICLGKSTQADPIECICEWIQQQQPIYTFHPSELTLPLTQAFANELEIRCSLDEL